MPGDRQLLRQQLYRLAAGQAGYFTAAQAQEIGYSYQAQKYHVDHGNWMRIDRGIFRIPEWPTSFNDELVRWVLWSHDRGAISHDSAAAAHELGVANPANVHLTVPVGFRMREPGVRLHFADLLPDDLTLLDGARITTPLRTVIDIAATHYDAEFVEAVVTDALATHKVTRRRLTERLAGLDLPAQQVLRRILDVAVV